jgi:hypothetical protein
MPPHALSARSAVTGNAREGADQTGNTNENAFNDIA